MSKVRSPIRSKKAQLEQDRQRLSKRLRIALGIAVSAGLVAGALGYWDRLTGGTPDKVVNVYRTHSCECAFDWARELRRDGYAVRLREYETLQYVRHSMHVPQEWKGCHVAEYLGYFIEGHVSSGQLERLRTERPPALGLTATLGASTDQHASAQSADRAGAAFLVGRDGHARAWQTKPAHNAS